MNTNHVFIQIQIHLHKSCLSHYIYLCHKLESRKNLTSWSTTFLLHYLWSSGLLVTKHIFDAKIKIHVWILFYFGRNCFYTWIWIFLSWSNTFVQLCSMFKLHISYGFAQFTNAIFLIAHKTQKAKCPWLQKTNSYKYLEWFI